MKSQRTTWLLILAIVASMALAGCNWATGKTSDLDRRRDAEIAQAERDKAQIRATDMPDREKAHRIADIETALNARLAEIERQLAAVLAEDSRTVKVVGDTAGDILPAPIGAALSGILTVVAGGLGYKAKKTADMARARESEIAGVRNAAAEIVKAMEPIVAGADDETKAMLKRLWSPEARHIIDQARGKTNGHG